MDNLLPQAMLAIRQLESLRAASAREYRDRIRRLRAAVDGMVTQSTSGDQLMACETSLAPELVELIKHPDRGL